MSIFILNGGNVYNIENRKERTVNKVYDHFDEIDAVQETRELLCIYLKLSVCKLL